MNRKLRMVFLGAMMVFAGIFAEPVSADTNNFYFKDFTADYYVSSDDEDGSRMRVVENLTAVFPDYKQNKGICREIPFLNQDGKNRTIEYLDESNLTVLRNGESEPIYSIEKYDNYYEVCTGTEEYVTGEQKYTFEYEFSRVITEFSKNEKSWQELYWNTNGTGWSQKFEKVTARVHFENTEVLTGETWCYVGSYGESGQDRCVISKTSDGFSFVAEDLMAGENLTYDIEIKDGSFVIPEPEKSYLMYGVLVVVAVICGLIVWGFVRGYRKTAERRNFYDGCFVKPEYEPNEKYSLLEQNLVSMKMLKNVKVALLLKMIVEKKIEMIRGEKKVLGGYNWSIRVLKANGLTEEEGVLLQILNGGEEIANNSEIQIKNRVATTKLMLLGVKFDEVGENAAIAHELVIPRKQGANKTYAQIKKGSSWAGLIFVGFLLVMFGMPLMVLELEWSSDIYIAGVFYVDFLRIGLIIAVVAIATTIVCSVLWSKTGIFKYRTNEGLKVSRELEGLELYIKMAEKDRLEFFQSKQNAEVTPEGVVKLYEKLLPYAALFGVEESWMKELSEYCQTNDLTTPVWCEMAMIHDFSMATRSAAMISDSSSHYGGSSGSGGGGGGFSGGGGGGGGGGGR